MANKEGCELLLFAGDLIAPTGVQILEKFKGNVKVVWGNNEAERVGLTRKFDASKNIQLAGDIYEDKVDEIKIFMNHYSRISELAAQSGEFDLCIYGHTHEYLEKIVGNTLLVNPGEIQGYGTGNVTFIIYDTSTKETKKFTL